MRRVALVFLTVFGLGLPQLVAAFPKWNDLDGYTFEAWAAEAGRKYRPGEEAKRKAIFGARLQDIQKHNADPTQTYRAGVNQFTDWTKEEFAQFNTARGLAPRDDTISSDVPTETFHTSNNGFSFTFHADMYFPSFIPTPHSVDYRLASPAVLTAIKDQGRCGACWAFSTTESVETHFAIQFGRLPVLSPQQVSSCSIANNGCGGGDAYFGFQYVQLADGLYEEWVYPYTDYFNNATKADTAECRNITAEWKYNFVRRPVANVKTIWAVERNNVNATMEVLAFRGPVSVSVSTAGWYQYESGVFQNPPTGAWNVDHLVQLVGYGHDDSEGVDYWIVRNSWGTSWGEAGYIRLLRPLVEPCGSPTYGTWTNCGTSSVLAYPTFPETKAI